MKRGVRTSIIFFLVLATLSLVSTLEADNRPPIPPLTGPGACQSCYARILRYPTGNYVILYGCGPANGNGGNQSCIPDADGCWMGRYCFYA
jgi:hypothetical protein